MRWLLSRNWDGVKPYPLNKLSRPGMDGFYTKNGDSNNADYRTALAKKVICCTRTRSSRIALSAEDLSRGGAGPFRFDLARAGFDIVRLFVPLRHNLCWLHLRWTTTNA
jgi:hypothetical protein